MSQAASHLAEDEATLATLTPARLSARGRVGLGVPELRALSLAVRRDIVTMLIDAGSGHSGGPLSCADFGVALFFNELALDPADPAWPGRHLWHFSIGPR